MPDLIGVHKKSKKEVSVRVVSKKNLTTDQIEHVRQEIRLHEVA